MSDAVMQCSDGKERNLSTVLSAMRTPSDVRASAFPWLSSQDIARARQSVADASEKPCAGCGPCARAAGRQCGFCGGPLCAQCKSCIACKALFSEEFARRGIRPSPSVKTGGK